MRGERMRVRRAGAAGLAALLLAASLLTAVPALAAAAEEGRARARRREEWPHPRLGVRGPLLAVRYGTPLRWSGGLTAILSRHYDVDGMPCAKGPLLGLAAGAGGAELSVGHTVGWHLLGYFPHGVLFGTAIRAKVVRTWGEPRATEPDATYVGAEFEIGAWFFNASLGYLVRSGGADAAPDGLVTWSVGIGF